MDCRKHPGVAAVAKCVECAGCFCGSCLVDIHGKRYCGSCKLVTVRGKPMPEEGNIACKEAGDAFVYAIIACFWVGIIFGPIAIFKALRAEGRMAADPQLTGSGKASAGLMIGIAATVLSVIAIIFRWFAKD